MKVSLQDLFEKPDIFAGSLTTGRCSKCDVELQETLTGKRDTPLGPACSDCYFDQLGAEVEKSPIGSAGVRRR